MSIKQRLLDSNIIVGNIWLTYGGANTAIEDTKTPAVLGLGRDSIVRVLYH